MILDQSFRRFSLEVRNARNDINTSVLVLCISTRRLAELVRSVTRVSRSLHNSSTVALSFSKYAFFLNLVFLACARLRSRLAITFSASVMLDVSIGGGSSCIAIFNSDNDNFFDLTLRNTSPSVSLAETSIEFCD